MFAPLITPEKKTPAPKPMTANIMTMIAIQVSKPIRIPSLSPPINTVSLLKSILLFTTEAGIYGTF